MERETEEDNSKGEEVQVQTAHLGQLVGPTWMAFWLCVARWEVIKDDPRAPLPKLSQH